MKFWYLLSVEFKFLITDISIAMTIFAAAICYVFLYPLPYWHQVPTQQNIVVVDHDNSTLSRQFIRYANANPKLHVISHAESLSKAQQWISKGWAHGLLLIPANFNHNILTGKGATLMYAADASYFLTYSAIIQGLVATDRVINQHIQLNALLLQGKNKLVSEKLLKPVSINPVPVFNHGLGYTAYVVPGLFLLILHQTLLASMAITGASQWRKKGYWSKTPILKLMTVRFTLFLIIYGIFSLLYVSYCYYFYQVNRLAQAIPLLVLLLSFLAATIACGLAFSTLFCRRDLPTQVIILISMPILFASGFVWPLSLIPAPITWLSNIVPATPAIMAMLKLNQMGATWENVLPLWIHLWLLSAVYLVLACWGFHYRLKESQHTAVRQRATGKK